MLRPEGLCPAYALNVLVQGYLRIDPERVAEHLGTAPVRFSRFARAVRDWLAQHAG